MVVKFISKGNNVFIIVVSYLSLFSYESPRSREEIVETAEYYLENKEEWGEYSLVSNNCEHFATYCATGKKKSGQVVKGVVAGIVGIGLAAKIASDLLGNKDEDEGSVAEINKDSDSAAGINKDSDSTAVTITNFTLGLKFISKLLND